MSDTKQRIQKLLADYGIGSRRQIERWIKEGRIMVNGQPATIGMQADRTDKFQVDGKLLKLFNKTQKTPRVIIYHKPEGQVCSRKAMEEVESVFKFLPKLTTSRWVMVGRLDVNTSGLLLFTTSGELANKLMHPSAEIDREYACRILGEVKQGAIQNMLRGVEDEGERLQFDSIHDGGGTGVNHWYHVTLQTGKNREVRRLWESQGCKVSRLIRVRYGIVELPPRLKVGKCVDLDEEVINKLLKI